MQLLLSLDVGHQQARVQVGVRPPIGQYLLVDQLLTPDNENAILHIITTAAAAYIGYYRFAMDKNIYNGRIISSAFLGD